MLTNNNRFEHKPKNESTIATTHRYHANRLIRKGRNNIERNKSMNYNSTSQQSTIGTSQMNFYGESTLNLNALAVPSKSIR